MGAGGNDDNDDEGVGSDGDDMMTSALDASTTVDLMRSAAEGDSRAAGDLVKLLYAELKRAAQAQLRRQAYHTISPTTLVHEAFLRLVGRDAAATYGTRHFFFAAARAMHDVLVERARAAVAQKRGGGRAARVDLEDLQVAADAPPEGLLSLHEALERLGREDEQLHQLVMLRFFGGLSMPEISAATGVPQRTLERDWKFARAKLHRDLSDS